MTPGDYNTTGRQSINVKNQDSSDLDAFGRIRTSNPYNIFDIQFNYDLQPLFFEESAIGGGSVTHVTASSAARLSTGGTTDGDGVIFQTKQYFRYQPGKSQFVVFTGILGAKTSSVKKRVGIFDSENGFFFEQDENNLKIVRRTNTSDSVVDNTVNQSSWNVDVLDGTGISGIILDETKDNLFIIDYQWLGAGRIRFGFDFGGQITYVHQIKFANTETVPFTVTGNLPFRTEIFNTSTAAGATIFDFTCVAIVSEGGFNPTGIPASTLNTTLRNVTTSNDPFPVISIRPKTIFNSITNRGIVIPKSYGIMSEDTTIYYEIKLNATLSGSSFTDVDIVNSMVEVDTAASGSDGGVRIASGFITGGKDKTESGVVNEEIMNKLVLTNNIAGSTTDILTILISIINSAGTATDCAGAFDWKELR